MNKIGLRNFKSFKDIEVKLNQLNVFSGTNGAGKSTVIQALLLLMQSKDFFSKETFKEIILSGYYFDSSLKEITNFDNESNLQIVLNDKEYIFDDTSNNDRVNINTDIDFAFFKEFDFIGADRLGPQRHYINNLPYENRVGKHGENFTKILSQNDKIISIVENTLSKIFDENYKLEANYDDDTKIASLKIGIENGKKITPIQMPFGVSYVLPILVSISMSLIFKEKRLVIIENPEAHLHPRAQSYLGRVIVEFLTELGNLMIILETHSEHIVNGILISSKNLKFNENVLINFFTKKDKKNEELTINKNGEIEQLWPENFFDQSIKDALELMKNE
jgi:predicted ATPase